MEKYTTYPDSVLKPSITKDKNVLAGKEFGPLRNNIDLFYSIVDYTRHLFIKYVNELYHRISRQDLF